MLMWSCIASMAAWMQHQSPTQGTALIALRLGITPQAITLSGAQSGDAAAVLNRISEEPEALARVVAADASLAESKREHRAAWAARRKNPFAQETASRLAAATSSVAQRQATADSTASELRSVALSAAAAGIRTELAAQVQLVRTAATRSSLQPERLRRASRSGAAPQPAQVERVQVPAAVMEQFRAFR